MTSTMKMSKQDVFSIYDAHAADISACKRGALDSMNDAPYWALDNDMVPLHRAMAYLKEWAELRGYQLS